MKTNLIGKSFTIEKILKIDFKNFPISWKDSKSISWTFLGSLHNEIIVKYVFHEMPWKKHFTVYPCYKTCNFIKKWTLAQVFSCEFAKFLRTPLSTEHFWWLLLHLIFFFFFWQDKLWLYVFIGLYCLLPEVAIRVEVFLKISQIS